MMSTMNLALVAGVAALLVLLLVMRRKTADGGSTPTAASGASKVKPAKPAKAPRAAKVKAAKPPKARRERGRRGRRGKDDAPPAPHEPMPLGATTSAASAAAAAEQDTSEFALPTAPAPGEPDWDAMRAAMNGTTAPAPEQPGPEPAPVAEQLPPAPPAPAPAVAQGMQEGWSDAEIITAPGWPLPGDMDGGGWEDAGEPATIGGAAATAGDTEEADAGGWLGQTASAEPAPAPPTPAAAPPADDADGAMWAEDPLTSWKAAQEADADAPAAEAPADTPWLGGGDTAWGTPAETPTPTGEVDADADADGWVAPVLEDATPTPGWDAPASVADEPAWNDAGWDAPAPEPERADWAEEAPAADWAPAEPAAPVTTGEQWIGAEAPAIGGWAAEADPAPEAAWGTPDPEPIAAETAAAPVADETWDAAWQAQPEATESWDAPGGDTWTAEEPGAELVGAGAESAATLAPEAPLGIGGWAAMDDAPDAPVAPAGPADDWPAADPDDAWAAALAQAQPDAAVAEPAPAGWDHPEPTGAGAPDVAIAPEVPAFVAERLTEPQPEVAATVSQETAPVTPEPLAVAPPAPVQELAPAEVETPSEPASQASTDDGLAWWDDPDPDTLALAPGEVPVWLASLGDERYTGRWSLGGMALQAGHQALTGVSFRQPVEEAPGAWTLPTRQRPDAGTLVLVVEATMNCEVADIAVLTEDGFAPNREGFTMTLRASATGPFAASGTFRLMQ